MRRQGMSAMVSRAATRRGNGSGTHNSTLVCPIPIICALIRAFTLGGSGPRLWLADFVRDGVWSIALRGATATNVPISFWRIADRLASSTLAFRLLTVLACDPCALVDRASNRRVSVPTFVAFYATSAVHGPTARVRFADTVDRRKDLEIRLQCSALHQGSVNTAADAATGDGGSPLARVARASRAGMPGRRSRGQNTKVTAAVVAISFRVLATEAKRIAASPPAIIVVIVIVIVIVVVVVVVIVIVVGRDLRAAVVIANPTFAKRIDARRRILARKSAIALRRIVVVVVVVIVVIIVVCLLIRLALRMRKIDAGGSKQQHS